MCVGGGMEGEGEGNGGAGGGELRWGKGLQVNSR